MGQEHLDTIVVGAGQAGLATSEHLGNNGVNHIVFERDRIAERWRTARWDSLVANGPAWHDRFPTKEFSDIGPDAFATKDQVTQYFEEFAQQINAPIQGGVDVTSVRRHKNRPGFEVQTSAGLFSATNVVAATGPFQRPLIPPLVPKREGLTQLHSFDYKNPQQLPDGGVLVVGAGSSGAQIADELVQAGRQVHLSVGPHDRPPRAYRGRDYCWWLGVLGKWDIATVDPDTAHVTISVSGADGGHTVDFRRFANNGMTLVGMTERFENGAMIFADDLAQNISNGDENLLSLLDEADDYVVRNGVTLPEDPLARELGPMPACVTDPVRQLNLQDAGIHTIIWATGYALDFSWLQVDVFDGDGKPQHQRGVTAEPGIYFVGLPWLSRRGSSFIWGVWHDAKYLADHIITQRNYQLYHESRGNK